MADNVGYTPGAGASVAADDIGGVLHQRVKVVIGADGTNDGDVSSSNPLPVSGAVTVASLPLPTGASTSAKQDTGNTSLSSIDGKTPALGQALAAASTPVVLTAAQVTTLTPLKPADTLAAVTTLGTITNALPAGTNLMGKVGIDQTTPGTSNGVVLNSGVLTAIAGALPAGSNVIGSVDINSGTATVTGDVGITGVAITPQGALSVDSNAFQSLINIQAEMLQEMKALRLLWTSISGQQVQTEDLNTPWAH